MSNTHVIISGGGFESMYVANLLAGKLPHLYKTPVEKDDLIILAHVNYGQATERHEFDMVCTHKTIFDSTYNVKAISISELNMFTLKEKEACVLFGGKDSNKTPELKNRNKKIIKATTDRIRFDFPVLKEHEATFYLGFEPKEKPYDDCTEEFLNEMYGELQVKFFLEAPILGIFKTEEEYLHSLKNDKLYGYVWSCWTPKYNIPCGTCSHCVKHKKMWGTKNSLMMAPTQNDTDVTPSFFDMSGLPT